MKIKVCILYLVSCILYSVAPLLIQSFTTFSCALWWRQRYDVRGLDLGAWWSEKEMTTKLIWCWWSLVFQKAKNALITRRRREWHPSKMELRKKRRLTYFTIGVFYYLGGVEYGEPSNHWCLMIIIFIMFIFNFTMNRLHYSFPS